MSDAAATKTAKVALITGANKGIGLETARQLGALGITVLVGSRDPKKGEAAAAELKREGIDAHAIKLDVMEDGRQKGRCRSDRTRLRQAGYFS